MTTLLKILIIDDDKKLTQLLNSYLAKFNFQVWIAHDPQSGMDSLRKNKPDAIILDVMLPGRDGFEVCREIRKESRVPILMLTARGEVTDRVVGLELGADDYLSKPFEPRELVARIHSILRRVMVEPQNVRNPEVLKAGELILDFSKRDAFLSGKALLLTTLEFELLALFMQNAEHVLNRDQIMDKIRGIDWEAYNRSIDVGISRLRAKLGDDPKVPRFFKTVWGSGYVFLGKVEKA